MRMETGVQGAASQSWRKANPRDLLREVINDLKGTDASPFQEFCKRLEEHPDRDEYMKVIIEYWFAKNYHSLVNHMGTMTAAIHRKNQQSRVDEIKGKIEEKIKERAAIMLLDMMMTNGKALKDCTGRECKKLSGTIGVWLRHVGSRVPANKKVGEVLSEDQLQELYGASQ